MPERPSSPPAGVTVWPPVSGSLDVWPDPEALVCSWLRSVLPGVNVRTETNSTFGTAKPDDRMRCPLVLVTAVTSGMGDLTTRTTQHANVDVACYASPSPGADDARAKAWQLHGQVHAWMLRAAGQTTPAGTFDDVFLHDSIGIVPDSNPNLRRVIATYGIATRPQATA